MGKTTVTRRAFAQLAAATGAIAAMGVGTRPAWRLPMAIRGRRASGGSRRYARAAAAAERSNAVCGCTSKMAKWFEPKVTNLLQHYGQSLQQGASVHSGCISS